MSSDTAAIHAAIAWHQGQLDSLYKQLQAIEQVLVYDSPSSSQMDLFASQSSDDSEPTPPFFTQNVSNTPMVGDEFSKFLVLLDSDEDDEIY